MSRSKRFNKLLRKIDGREGSVSDNKGNFVGRGKLTYCHNNGEKSLYLNDEQIPTRAIRNINPCFNPEGWGGVLIFVSPAYELAERFR